MTLPHREEEQLWKLCQDILPVGSRIFRKNAEKRCMEKLDGGLLCLETQDGSMFSEHVN